MSNPPTPLCSAAPNLSLRSGPPLRGVLRPAAWCPPRGDFLFARGGPSQTLPYRGSLSASLAAAFSALLLAGCSLMPDYQRPAAPVPEQWPTKVGAGETAPSTDWRAFFPDPRLQAMIGAALEHNRDLRIAVARVAEARALYGIQDAERLPGINLGGGQTAAHIPAQLSSSGRETTTRRHDVNVGLLAFELDFWGRVASLGSAARASYLASAAAQRAFRLSLIAEVADAYLGLREATERAALARATLASRADTRQLVGKRREVGLAGDLDYLQADGAYLAARAELASLERQQGQAENLLRALVGFESPDWPAGRSLADQGIAPALAADIPATVLTRRPDILAAEQRLIAANANIGAARAAFFPRISLTALFGTASPQLSGLFAAGSAAWSFQPSLTLPIFDSGRTAASLDLAAVRKNIAVAEYEKAIQQAFREVADALVAREKLAEQLASLGALEQSQQQRLVLAEARYGQGVSSFLEVLDAQRDVFTARQNLIQTRRALLSTAARLYKALGGDTYEVRS
jgi:multidrug efflux system outer membrane protein